VVRKRLSVLVAMAMMLAMTLVSAGMASTKPGKGNGRFLRELLAPVYFLHPHRPK
jgi:hypothetical protein